MIASTVSCAVALLQVEHGDGQPVGGEALGGGRADAPRGAGDDGDPWCLVWHRVPPGSRGTATGRSGGARGGPASACAPRRARRRTAACGRWPTGRPAGVSWLTPAAPCAWIALSITHSAIAGVAILMAWISVCAPLLPTVSISQAVLSTSSRACSIRTRDSAIQSWITPCSASGLPNATRPVTRWHISSSARSADADQPHAVVDPARARAGPGRWRTPRPRPAIRFSAGTRTSVNSISACPPCGAVVVAEHAHAALDVHAGGVPGHQDHRLLPVPLGVRVGLAHHDEDLAARVHRPGRPPLAAVDHVLVAVALDPGARCWWRRRRRRPARSCRTPTGSRRRAAA